MVQRVEIRGGGRVVGFEVPVRPVGGDEAGDVAFLRFLEDEFGLRIPWEETEAELPSAAFM